MNFSWLKVILSLCVVATLWSTSGECAESPKVLLVYPAEAEPSVSAALVRVRGELVADGFDVVMLRAKPGTSSAEAMTEAEHNAGSATVGLFLSADGAEAELWVVDKLTDKTVVRRVDTTRESSSQLSEVLAVRAVELLRASLLEFLVEQPQAERRSHTSIPARPVTEEAQRKASDWAVKPLNPRSLGSFNVEAGPCGLLNPGQVDPQFGVVAAASAHVMPVMQLRISAIGFGSRPHVVGNGGSVALQQAFGFAEVLGLPWPRLRVRPLFVLGVGAHHLSIDSEANWPYRPIDSSVWTFALDAGAGLEWKFNQRLALAGEGHVMASIPHPRLYFVAQPEAKVGYPTLGVWVTLRVTL